jgi:hypothetical protein
MERSLATARPARTMGHFALHYAKPNEGPLAARLLSLLGFINTQSLPLPNGTLFYRFVVDQKNVSGGDGIVYLSAVPPAQQAVIDAMRAALRVGSSEEHPAVGGLRAAQEADPEYGFHVGILLESLESLEETVLNLRKLAEVDPELKGRLKVVLNRSLPGTPEVDARLDASPLYGSVTRYAYGRNGVQAFITTDILSSGPLGEDLVVELDYIFPGYDRHVLSVVEV